MTQRRRNLTGYVVAAVVGLLWSRTTEDWSTPAQVASYAASIVVMVLVVVPWVMLPRHHGPPPR